MLSEDEAYSDTQLNKNKTNIVDQNLEEARACCAPPSGPSATGVYVGVGVTVECC